MGCRSPAALPAEAARAALDPGVNGVTFAPAWQVAGAAHSVFARDTQHFLDRRVAAQHPRAAVVADRGGAEACAAVDLLLRDTVMNHGAHGIVDHDQLVDSRTAVVAAGGIAPGAVEPRRGPVRREGERPPL